MALVVEDGTGDDPAANSYATLAELRAYNTSRGRAFASSDVNDAALEALAIRAMDYIESLEGDMRGTRTYGLVQPLAFPRAGLYLDYEELPDDEIPVAVKNAQAELCFQLKSGVDIWPNQTQPAIKRRKVGPIEREFFGPSPSAPTLPLVDRWLAFFLATGSLGNIEVVRV